MWQRTRITERLNLTWPIFSAPMTPFATPSLAASVSNAGGVGGLGLTTFTVEECARRIAGFRQLTAGKLNANLLLWPEVTGLENGFQAMRDRIGAYYREEELGAPPDPVTSGSRLSEELLDVLLAAKPEVMSFHWSLPDRAILEALKANGTFVIGCATTVAEARILETKGADGIIAQGLEAGGHRGTFTDVGIEAQAGLFALLPQIVDACSVPVIAAGGISDGRSIAAAMALGADAVWIGTAFLRCPEALVPDGHREALRHANDAGTVVTRVVSGKPARVLPNKLVTELEAVEGGPLPFPAQYSLTKPLEAGGNPDLLQLYAGQAAALTRELSAEELVAKLADETDACFRAMNS